MSTLFFPDLQEDVDALPNYSYLKVHGDFFSTEVDEPQRPSLENLSPSMGPTSSRSSVAADNTSTDSVLLPAPLHTAPLPIDADVEEETAAHAHDESAATTERCRTEKKKAHQGRTTRCYCHRLSPTDGCRGCSMCCCCCCRLVHSPPPLFVALRMGTQSPRYLASRYYKPLALAPVKFQCP